MARAMVEITRLPAMFGLGVLGWTQCNEFARNNFDTGKMETTLARNR